MKKKTHWAWKIYFFLFCIGTLASFLLFLSGESLAGQYYRILTAFKPSYIIYNYLYALDAVINALSLVVLFLFVFHVRFFVPLAWKVLFFLRVFFFLTGHFYEWQTARSLMRHDPLLTLAAGALLLVIALPSYIACFHYAFAQERLFDDQEKTPLESFRLLTGQV